MCSRVQSARRPAGALLLAVLFLINHYDVFSQSAGEGYAHGAFYDAVADSLYGRLAEDAAADGEAAADYVDEILDAYRRFLHFPLDMNKASRRELERAGFLGQYRIASLMDYRERFGDVLSLTELSNVPGFGKDYVSSISRLISLGSHVPAGHSSAVGGGWEHDVTMRVKWRVHGGERPSFPLDRMLKYKASSLSGLSFGMAARSAPGEGWFQPGNLSAFVSYEPKSRIFRKIIIGDYNARFGQGGLMWSSFTMNSLSSATAVMKVEPGLSGYCTGGSGVRLRGAALELAAGDASVSLFGSYLYDYAGERDAGGKDVPFLAGANLSYWFSKFKVGVTGLWYGNDSGGKADEAGYGLSADVRLQLADVSLYAEAAYSGDFRDGSPGVWAGAEIPVGERWGCSLAGRYVPEDFSGKYSSPLSTDSGAENEYAITASFRRRSGLSADLILAADMAYFPETKDVGPGVDCQFKCRGEWRKGAWKTVTSLTLRGLYDVTSVLRGEWYAGVPKDADASGFGVNIRADVSLYSGLSEEAPSFGCGRVVAAEGSYRIAGRFASRLVVHARLALFHCDRWSERIYCYERDLYGSMSVPALYGKGMSAYVMAVYRPWRWLKLSFKAGLSWYVRQENETCISDLKFQCEVSL